MEFLGGFSWRSFKISQGTSCGAYICNSVLASFSYLLQCSLCVSEVSWRLRRLRYICSNTLKLSFLLELIVAKHVVVVLSELTAFLCLLSVILSTLIICIMYVAKVILS